MYVYIHIYIYIYIYIGAHVSASVSMGPRAKRQPNIIYYNICTILYYIISCYTILYYTILCYAILYYTKNTTANKDNITNANVDDRVSGSGSTSRARSPL